MIIVGVKSFSSESAYVKQKVHVLSKEIPWLCTKKALEKKKPLTGTLSKPSLFNC